MSVPDTSELLADSIAREEALRELISRRDAQLKTQRLDQVEIEVRLDALFRENIEQEQEIADLRAELSGFKRGLGVNELMDESIFWKQSYNREVATSYYWRSKCWWTRIDNFIKRLAKK